MTPINPHYSPMNISASQPTEPRQQDSRMEVSGLVNDDAMQDSQEAHQNNHQVHSEQHQRDSRMEVSSLVNDDAMQDSQEGSQDNYQPQSEQHQRGRLHGLMDISTLLNPSTETKATPSIAQAVLAAMIPSNVTLEQQQVLQQRLQNSQANLDYHEYNLCDEHDGPNCQNDYNKVFSSTGNSLFINAYSPQRTHFVALENNKVPGDRIYASDAALKQMALLEEGRSDMTIPSTLPAKITRSKVENEGTVTTVKDIFVHYGNNRNISLTLDLASPDSEENNQIQRILNTPNGKMTTNLIRDFNTLAGTDYHISALDMRIDLEPEDDFSNLSNIPVDRLSANINFTLVKRNEAD